MDASMHQHRGVDIVVSQVLTGKWLVTWIYPGEDEAVQVYRYGEKWDALAYAQVRIDSWLANGLGAKGIPEARRSPSADGIIWRKGEDCWSGIEVENGYMPSDAVPYGLIGDEWQPLV